MMARAMLKAGNVLILDEPTNHLDLESITALNKGMINYKSPMLFTSQDHEILQTVANRIVVIDEGKKAFDKETTYDEYLELWEWGIINDEVNYNDGCPILEKDQIYYCTYEQLLELFGNEKDAKYVWDEIEFCRMMHRIRPQEWERGFSLKK